jgi:hypothetical protein
MDRTRPEYEPLLVLKFVKPLCDFNSKTTFLRRLWGNLFGKILFFKNFVLITKIDCMAGN